MAHKKGVLLLGSYGQTNLGDDLLMWNYLELLGKKDFKRIYVNVSTKALIPQIIREKYPDIEIVETYRTSMRSWIRILRSVECAVYGGGTIYKELYASTGRSKYSVIRRLLAFNWLARFMGVKVYHLNIGIGSLRTWRGRMITKWALTAATYSVFRDDESYKFALARLGISERKVCSSTDGLFLNPIWQKPWRPARLPATRKKYKAVVGINALSDIPDWVNREKYITAMRRFVQRLLDAGVYVVFLPFQHAFNPRNDLVFMQEEIVAPLGKPANLHVVQEVPLEQASSYMRQFDVFVGMRFHSLLLAAANATPFVAIAYDTKCWRFIEEANYPHAVKIEDLTFKKLIQTYNNALGQRKTSAKQLQAVAADNFKEAHQCLRRLHF
ncbi:MAG: polysaccharide pyruvyl transferase family protein [Candidatus Saccharimonadales bacterium]